MPREATIQAGIIAYLKSLPGVTAENVHGNAFQSGRPDINACVNGQLLRLEAKSPDHGNKASDLQKANMRQWRAAGALCCVVYSVSEVKKLVRQKTTPGKAQALSSEVCVPYYMELLRRENDNP